MATEKARFQAIVDSSENWKRANPILLEGEIGLEKLPQSAEVKSNYAIKIGDGVTPWKRLPYIACENNSVVEVVNIPVIATFEEFQEG